MRERPEDFQVSEVLGFEPSGEGEHAFLHVEKRGANTEWVAAGLARFAGVKRSAVGFAGLKDRNAVTRQHFSVHLPGLPSPDWSALELEGVSVLAATRHGRKIQRGALRGNRFRLVVRELSGKAPALEQRFAALAQRGVPNYFGPQRFGRGGENLDRAGELFDGRLRRPPRHKRSIYLSAARAHVFNAVLAARVADGSWLTGLDGEIYRLEGSRAQFGPEDRSAELAQRLERLDIHPTGPLWGRGALPTAGECSDLESRIAAELADLCQGLERFGLKQDRRALRVRLGEPSLEMVGDTATFTFTLPAGAYATVVMRELVEEAAAE